VNNDKMFHVNVFRDGILVTSDKIQTELRMDRYGS
jgi:hypothetical protein